MKVAQSCPTLCNPMDYTVHGILQARILEWVAFPFSRASSQPRNEPRSPAFWADSLPAEPPGEPKNPGVGNLTLLQRIFPTQESNGSPALQADSLPTELSAKPSFDFTFLSLLKHKLVATSVTFEIIQGTLPTILHNHLHREWSLN